MITWLVALALLTNGVAAGMMLSTVVGVVPMFLVLDYAAYVRAVQFLWPRYDPLMPVLTASTAVLDVIIAIAVPGPAAPLFAAGAAVMAVVIAISVLRNVPINRSVMALDPESRPDGWADPRRRWRTWNTLRTGLTVVALLTDLAATAALIRGVR